MVQIETAVIIPFAMQGHFSYFWKRIFVVFMALYFSVDESDITYVTFRRKKYNRKSTYTIALQTRTTTLLIYVCPESHRIPSEDMNAVTPNSMAPKDWYIKISESEYPSHSRMSLKSGCEQIKVPISHAHPIKTVT